MERSPAEGFAVGIAVGFAEGFEVGIPVGDPIDVETGAIEGMPVGMLFTSEEESVVFFSRISFSEETKGRCASIQAN